MYVARALTAGGSAEAAAVAANFSGAAALNASITTNEDTVLLSALQVNLPLFVVCVAIYSVLHTLFRAQFYQNPVARGKGPTPPAGGVLSFVPLVWRMSDDEWERHCGLDAFALVEFIRVGLRILGGYGLYGLSIGLLSTWGSSQLADAAWQTVFGESTLARLSLANMRSFTDTSTATWDMWGTAASSVVGAWLLTYLTITRLSASWRKLIARRLRSLADARDASSLVVLVRAGGLRGKEASLGEVRALWETLYPGQIWDVIMVRDTGKLPGLLARRTKLIQGIEALELSEAKAKAKGGVPAHKLLRRLRGRRDDLGALIGELKAEYTLRAADSNDVGSNYFVRFRQHRACNIAKQVLNTTAGSMQVVAAPLADDVAWASLRPAAERLALPVRVASTGVYYALLLFYAIPITFVSGLLELSELTRTFPFLEPPLTAIGPQGRAFLAAFLPTLALILFLAALPAICTAIASKQGHVSLGSVQRDAFSRLFLFQFVWVFLGVTLGSSAFALLENVEKIASNPATLLAILGGQLAENATFFMVYLCLQASFTLPFKELTRTVPIALVLARRAAAQATELAQKQAAQLAAKAKTIGKGAAAESDEGADDSVELAADADAPAPPPPPPEPFDFPVVWTKVMMAITLGVCYASIQPLSVLFAFAYLLLSFLFYGRGLLFSYTHACESRAAFWPAASGRLMLILFFAQLMLTGVHYIKQNLPTALAVALTMPLTYRQHRVFVTRYEPQLAVLPLLHSAGADVEAVEEGEEAAGQLSLSLAEESGAPPEEASRAAAWAEVERIQLGALFGDKYYQPELLEAAEIVGVPFRAPSMARGVAGAEGHSPAVDARVHLAAKHVSSTASGLCVAVLHAEAAADGACAVKSTARKSMLQRLSMAGRGGALPAEQEGQGLIEVERSERDHADGSSTPGAPS